MDNEEEYLSSLPEEIERFSAIGIGPGMGTKPETQTLLSFIIRRYQKPIVLDADALNCIAQNKDLLSQLPAGSILTPHPKEFDRLFGEHRSDFDRINTATEKARIHNIVIVVKSHHSFVATPLAKGWFNTTGNAGMAKGGSGDVLTGILTALLAQGYDPVDAALTGVYLHGLAGDVAASRFSKTAMLPSDLVACLPDVFLALEQQLEL
jgi:NAD(P)H-hydrate epimerase